MGLIKPIPGYHKFFWGLGIFIFSGSTIALVTDPYIMADFALIIFGLFLMVSGLRHWGRVENE